MFKILLILAYVGLLFIQTTPAYCEGSRTLTLQISVTMPEHIMANNNSQVTSFSNNSNQLVQTETVVRNNQNIRLTTIVVP